MSIEKTMSHVEREVYENEIGQLYREIERLRAENEVLRVERDHARACYERSVRVLTGIHALLYPPRFTDNDGRTWQFESPIVEAQMQELSDRIRAIPDELNAIDAALRGEGE